MLRDRVRRRQQKRLNEKLRLRQLDARALIDVLIECFGKPKPRRFKQRAQQRQKSLELHNARRLKGSSNE